MATYWDHSVDAHRRSVRDALLDAVDGLVHQHGVRGVTMSQVAETAGVGRATLYKYFPDVEAVLLAWHERHLAAHMEHLTRIRAEEQDAVAALAKVLTEYALGIYRSGGDRRSELGAYLHSREQVTQAHEQLDDLVRQLIEAAVEGGQVRRDVPAAELGAYCLYSMGAAAALDSADAVHRLVAVTVAGVTRVRD